MQVRYQAALRPDSSEGQETMHKMEGGQAKAFRNEKNLGKGIILA